jgi:hypothetical protein
MAESRKRSKARGVEKELKDVVADLENRALLAGQVATATGSAEVNLVSAMGTAVADSPGVDTEQSPPRRKSRSKARARARRKGRR